MNPRLAGDPGPSACWRFGAVRFDERKMELRVDGIPTEAPSKSLGMLLELLRHAGQLVTKQELAEACWPRRGVADNVLTTTLGRLRQALGEKDRGAIQTVMGHGYRLIAPVSFDGPAPPPLRRLSSNAGDHPPGRAGWTLVENLGGGGDSDVWLARPLTLAGTAAAPRVFKFAIDPRAIAALRREVAIGRLLRDVPDARNAIVPVLDSSLDTVPAFIAMPWLAGGNLIQWIARRGGPGALALEQRLDLAAQCAEVLGAAHTAGVLHTDLKPANILVNDEDEARPRIRLCDFGAGTVMNRERLRQQAVTQSFATGDLSDSSSGTLLYMAPEILAGASPNERSDIYSLGILLYQLVVGDFRRPLTADWEAEVGDELLREDISLCAAGDPRRRLGDAGQLAQRLRTLEGRRKLREQERGAQAPGVSILRLSYDGSRVNSRRFAQEHERVILAEHGARIRALELQGRLSFDATDAIARSVLQALPRTQFLILDLRRVTDVDAASARRLADLARALAQAGTLLHFTGVDDGPDFRRKLAREAPDLDVETLFRFPDSDRALEWCEDRLIAEHAPASGTGTQVLFEQQSLFEGFSAGEIEQLGAASQLCDFPAGETLFRTGDPAQSIFLIVQGRVDILLIGDDGREKRMVGYSDGMPLGEIALLTGGPRAFTARAVTPALCYEVSFADLDPALKTTLLSRLNVLVAQRLAKYASNQRVLGEG